MPTIAAVDLLTTWENDAPLYRVSFTIVATAVEAHLPMQVGIDLYDADADPYEVFKTDPVLAFEFPAEPSPLLPNAVGRYDVRVEQEGPNHREVSQRTAPDALEGITSVFAHLTLWALGWRFQQPHGSGYVAGARTGARAVPRPGMRG